MNGLQTGASERINRIIQNETYRTYLRKIDEYEKERVFCRHNTSHFLDVARLALLLYYQSACGGQQAADAKQCSAQQELLYAAALLHDIGRWCQYETGADHALESARLAPSILKESGFSEKEIQVITTAIASHRNSAVKEQADLAGLLYRADKLSRPCYFCTHEAECNWKNDKKNLSLLL
jgi:HD superfamily phosphodiesterase